MVGCIDKIRHADQSDCYLHMYLVKHGLTEISEGYHRFASVKPERNDLVSLLF